MHTWIRIIKAGSPGSKMLSTLCITTLFYPRRTSTEEWKVNQWKSRAFQLFPVDSSSYWVRNNTLTRRLLLLSPPLSSRPWSPNTPKEVEEPHRKTPCYHDTTCTHWVTYIYIYIYINQDYSEFKQVLLQLHIMPTGFSVYHFILPSYLPCPM
jgi:hypothetical protein